MFSMEFILVIIKVNIEMFSIKYRQPQGLLLSGPCVVCAIENFTGLTRLLQYSLYI